MNLQRNSSFVNRTQFPLLCEKSRAILRQASRLAVRRNSEILKSLQIASLRFSEFNEGTALKNWLFRVLWRHMKVGGHVFSCRSLLLSTTVLNDTTGESPFTVKITGYALNIQ